MDDEAQIRNLVKLMLRNLGYHSTCTRDGAETIQQYEAALEAGEKFDLVILDLTIPGGMGGEETIKKLRQIDPWVISIVASGYSESPVMAEYRDYGFCGRLTKPFDIKKMSEVLAEVISPARCGSPSTENGSSPNSPSTS